jgi:hypothetical protein
MLIFGCYMTKGTGQVDFFWQCCACTVHVNNVGSPAEQILAPKVNLLGVI